MRGKHHVGLVGANACSHFVCRAWHPSGLRVVRHAAGLEHHLLRGDAAHLKNLRPAVAEPTVAHHHGFFASSKLARHSLHAKGATARHQYRHWGAVHLFENGRNVGHDALEALGHVIERAVGVDHREFEQTVGVNLGQQAGHE